MQAAGGTQTLGWRRGREEQEGQLGQEGGGLRKSGMNQILTSAARPCHPHSYILFTHPFCKSVAVFSLNFPRPFTRELPDPQNMQG